MDLNCRSCSREIKNKTAFNIFVSHNKDDSAAMMLMHLASVKICEDDNLPKLICLSCFERLKFSYHFQKLIRASDLKFKQSLQKDCNLDENTILKLEKVDEELIDYPISTDEVTGTFVKNENNVHEDNREWITQNVILKHECESDNFTDNQQIICNNDYQESTNLFPNLEHSEEPGDYDKNEVWTKFKGVVNDDDPHIHNYQRNYRRILKLQSVQANRQKMRQSKNIYVCWSCEKRFKQFLQLKLHSFTHLHKNCGCRFNQSIGDIQKHTGEKSLSAKCDSIIHTHTQTAEKPFGCEYCDCEFNLKIDLFWHIQTHAGEKLYPCTRCKLRFTSANRLQNHMRTHTGEKFYKCDHCDDRFITSAQRTVHTRTHTVEESLKEKPHQCTVCKRKFSSVQCLKQHIIIHTGEKPFQCDHCGRTFPKKWCLYRHIRIHTGEKPYQCNHCDRAFAGVGSLSRHLRIHTGERPFKCDHCDRRFNTSYNRMTHIRTHTGEKLHQCVHCERGFASAQSLQNHIRLHTGEKPFECVYCERKFAEKGSLSRHIRTHKEEKDIQC